MFILMKLKMCLRIIPGVREVAVIGVPDENSGEA